MKKLLFTIVLCLFTVVFCFGQNSDEQNLNPLWDAIKSFCEGNENYLVNYLKQYESKNNQYDNLPMNLIESCIVLKSVILDVQNPQIEVHLLMNKETKLKEIFINFDWDIIEKVMNYDIPIDTYKQYYLSALNKFGKPHNQYDNYFLENMGENQYTHEITSDWIIGDNRIRFDEILNERDGRYLSFGPMIIVRNKQHDSELIPYESLNLKTVSSYYLDNQKEKDSDYQYNFILDYNRNRVLTNDLVYLSTISYHQDDIVVFRFDLSDYFYSIFTVSRTDGVFTCDYYSKETDKIVMIDRGIVGK